MHESIRVVAGELGPVGADELLRTSASSAASRFVCWPAAMSAWSAPR
jgi:hypothetical protein